MNGFEPGEGWREVGRDATAERMLVLHEAGKPTRVWAEDEPVLPLPTEPYTVIRVTWRDREDRSPAEMTFLDGDWINIHGSAYSSGWLTKIVAGFEVLARPAGEEAVARVEDRVRRETAKAVLDYVEQESMRIAAKTPYMTYEPAGVARAREVFGVES